MQRPTRSCRTRGPTITIARSSCDDDSDECLPDPPEKEYKPGGKRARCATSDGRDEDADERPAALSRKRAKRAGKLARLQQMPLDVLFEIFASLHPHDLLRVSRTTKTLRGLLMARSSRAIWMQALATIPDLPPCPDDLTEPAWTRLLFDASCHICNTKGVRNVFWCIRLRACSKCSTAMTPNEVLFPVRGYTGNLDFQDPVQSGFRIPWDRTWENNRSSITLFLLKDKREFEAAVHRRNTEGAEHQAWIDERTEKTRAMRKHAQLCESWHASQRMQRVEDLETSRQSRQDAILENLRGEGYGTVVDWMMESAGLREGPFHDFERMKCVRQPKDLTPRIWSNIKREVHAFMDALRSKHEVDTQLRTLRRRVELLVGALGSRTTSYAPRVIDLYSIESIRQILDLPLENGQDTVTAESFDAALSDYDGVVRHCESQRRPLLVAALHEGAPGTAADEASLELATALFECKGPFCRHSGQIAYRDALAHRCSLHSLYSDDRPNQNDWTATDRREQLRLVCDWVRPAGGSSTLCLDVVSHQVATGLVRSVGLDPGTATCADMDKLEAWFECDPPCATCSFCARRRHPDRGREVYRWRAAVVHARHYRQAQLRRITSDEEDDARAAESELMPKLDQDEAGHTWDCRLCTKTRMKAQELRDHCADTHDVSTLVYGTTHDASDRFMGPMPPVFIKQKAIEP